MSSKPWLVNFYLLYGWYELISPLVTDTKCGQTKIKVPVLTWCNQHIFGAFK